MNDLILARQHCNCEASYTLIIDCSNAHKPIASLGDLVMVLRSALILGADGLVDHRRHVLNSREPEVHGLRPRTPSGSSGGDSFHPGWVMRTSPWCLA
jgi:hypothetical protein